MHSYLYDTQQLENRLGMPLPADEHALPGEILQNEYLKRYYSLMIEDIHRRKTEVRSKKAMPVVKQRTLGSTSSRTKNSAPDTLTRNAGESKKLKKGKKRTIREYNAPRGVDYEASNGEYTSQLTVNGEVLQIPPSVDPDVVVKRRKLLEDFIAQSAASDTFVSQIRELLHGISAAQVNPVPEVPVSRDLSTPVKPLSASSANPGTPMTVPHKVLAQTDMDVLKFRDKYYCRFSVFSDYISTPMRRTRAEAENDLIQVRAKLKTFESILKNPLAVSSNTAMDKILDEMKAFSTSLDGGPSMQGTPIAASRVPQTEIKPRSSIGGLPDGVFRMREKFYTTVSLFGKVISTPCRTSLVEVLDDKEFLLTEAAKRPAVGEGESLRVIDEIKKALQDHEQIRTPRKPFL